MLDLILNWDPDEIIEKEVQYRLDNLGEFPESGETAEEIRKYLTETGFTTDEWDLECDCLGSILKTKNPTGKWVIDVKNFGWRRQSGTKTIQLKNAADGAEFLQQILPKCECNFKVYDTQQGIAINNFHHDNSTGDEWYYARA